jgi:hypothetical protein
MFRPAMLLPRFSLPGLLSLAAVTSLSAQDPSDTLHFTVLRNTDTVAVESFVRTPTEVTGVLMLPGRGERVWYHLVVAPDETTPLVEVNAWRKADPEQSPPRQRTRVIFKSDSAAVDDMTSKGMATMVFPTQPGALPYFNLSFAFLERATVRAFSLPGDSVAVPFFSLSGGQTVVGSVRRVAPDSALVEIGSVEFHLRVNPKGQVLGGSIPSQQVTALFSGGGS